MLARHPDTEENAEIPPNRLKIVGERPVITVNVVPTRQPRVPIVGRLIARVREGIRQQPERTTRLLDRLVLVLVIIVLLVSAYVLIADPS